MHEVIKAAESAHKKFVWAGIAMAVAIWFIVDASESVRGGLGFINLIIFDLYGRLEVAEAKNKVARLDLEEKTKELAKMLAQLEGKLENRGFI